MIQLDWPLILTAIGTLAVWSFLYRENSIYRLFEHIFVGYSAAHFLVVGAAFILSYVTKTSPVAAVVSTILGIATYFYFSKRYFYIYRYTISFMVGVGTALFIRGSAHVNLVAQIGSTMVPLIEKDWITTVSNWVLIIGVLCSAYYFIFTFSREGIAGAPSKLGRWVMMGGFGAAFGNIIMTRMATTFSRVAILLNPKVSLMTMIAIALIVLDIFLRHRQKMQRQHSVVSSRKL